MKPGLFWRVSVAAGGASYDVSRDLSTFTVEEEDRAPTRLTVEMNDHWTVFSHAFQEGMEVTAELGTEDEHRVVFRGRIYHVDAGLPQDTPTLTFKAYDASMVMGLRERNRRFRDMKLSAVVTAVATPHLNGKVQPPDLLGDPEFKGEGLRQREETDLCFLRRLAEHAQCAMGVIIGETSDQFIFKAHQRVLKGTPAVVLHYGRCDIPNRLLSFNGTVDVGDVAIPQTLSSIDPLTGAVVAPRDSELLPVGRAEDRLRDDNLATFEERYPERGTALRDLVDAAPDVVKATHAELGKARRAAIPTFAPSDQVFEHRAQEPSASLHGMQASGRTVGNQDLHVRSALDVEGAGRMSGTWFVSKATHILDRQAYHTEFTCTR